MNRDEAITELCQFLEEQGGEVEEITSKKLWDRAEIIEDPDRPHCIVFTLERHRGIIGASYTRGYGMTAFVTYWPVYEFDRQTRTLDEMDGTRPDEVHIDYDSFAEENYDLSFDLSPISDGKWEYHESCYGEGGIVSSQKELEEAVSVIIDNMDYTAYINMLSENCSGTEAVEHVRRLVEAYGKKAQAQARRSWAYAQEEFESR
jgi:hypothetical protein